MAANKYNTANLAGVDNIQNQSMISANSSLSRNFELQCGNRTLSMFLNFTPGMLKLSDLIPTARDICDKLVEATLADPKNASVTCTKGCSHCCNYLVPISHPEAAMIHQEINRLPEYKRKSLISRSLTVAKKILKTQKFPDPKNSDTREDRTGLYEISSWYTELNVSCPFLLNSSCVIYNNRPLACREHLVKSPASRCKLGSNIPPQKILTPTSITRALSNTSCKLKNLRTSAVMLPFIFPWMELNKVVTQQTWPTEMLVDTFIDELQKLSKETRDVKKKTNIVEIKGDSRIPIRTLPSSYRKKLNPTHAY